MSQALFRVRAKDAHFNGQERVFTYPADNAEALRHVLQEHMPHLTFVRILPFEQGLREELSVARRNAYIDPKRDEIVKTLVGERLRCCEDLAILLGTECMVSLLAVLSRFQDQGGRFRITGLDACMFSFSFCRDATRPLCGGLIFHRDSKTWGTHT